MASKRRLRKRRPARKTKKQEPRRRFLVVCEGEATEPNYFNGYVNWTRNATIKVDIPPEHGVPLTLVREARERMEDAQRDARTEKDSFLAYDEVWCVFDIDEHPNINDAIQLADANSISLAVSNPCFELWLLLHFRENPGAQHRNQMEKLLSKYRPGYNKHIDFKDFISGVEGAHIRAKRLDDDAKEMNEPGRNPTTGVYLLTQALSRK